MRIYRGDIVIANLEPIKGSEQGGIRPVLIIQNNVSNKYSPLTIVAPITSRIPSRKFITNVFLSSKDSKLKKDSIILLNQIRTIDKRRVNKKISSINHNLLKKVNQAIKISLDLN